MTKYYSNPTDYEVSDGFIRRNGFWSLQIDNNHSEYVIVFLGDLGTLSHKEQLYWKSFNIYANAGISKANWERSFQARFSDPNEPDLYFKLALKRFKKKWFEKFGWHLFKPLSEDDSHHIKSLRIPLTESQKEFDEQILSLTKILIDSLNERKITQNLEVKLEPNTKGISKFEAFLESKQFDFPDLIKFLRDLQELRSTGSAHRKSSNYSKVREKFGITDDNRKEIFIELLLKAIMLLNTLGVHLIDESYVKTK